MHRALLSILAVSSLAIALPAAAQGQRWPSIRSRQPMFEQRLGDGVRAGVIPRDEADRLQDLFDALLAREQDYRYSRPGLTRDELEDLDSRFDDLYDQLSRDLAGGARGPDRRAEPPPTDRYVAPPPPPPPAATPAPAPPPDRFSGVDEGWPSMNERRDELMAQIEAGVASGDLTRADAAGLRQDFEGLVRREDFYRQDGTLSPAERRDLDMAFAELSRRLHRERSDDQRKAVPPAPAIEPPAAAVAPPTAAPPPPAAPESDDSRWRDIRNIQADLDDRIDQAKAKGVIDDTEAERLHDDASDLVRLEDDYRASPPGLTRDEIADLDARIATIEERVNREPPPPKPAPEPPARRDSRDTGETIL